MQKSIFLILTILTTSLGFSQDKPRQFPQDFLGIYKGALTIEKGNKLEKITMEFHLKKTERKDHFDYVLIYDGTPRNYTLIVKDRAKGLFEVDENNGIILSAKLTNNVLYSFFEVQGNLLSSRFEFSEHNLDLEILFCKISDKTKSGAKNSDSPYVFNYPVTTIQNAVLNRVKIY